MSVPERIFVCIFCAAIMLVAIYAFGYVAALLGAVLWLMYSNICNECIRRRAERARTLIHRDYSGRPPDRDHMEM